MGEIKTEVFSHLSYDDCEVLRYMGARETTDEIHALLESCKPLCEDIFTPSAVYACYDISVGTRHVDFGDFTFESADLATRLTGCKMAVLFVATAGFAIDRLIKKYSTLSPARALTLSAIGTAYTESVCDALCTKLRHEYGATLPRYGIGYGDLPLACQKEIFTRLDVTKRIGVTLNDSLLMSPTKTVSAVVGIGACDAPHIGCEACEKTNCEFKR